MGKQVPEAQAMLPGILRLGMTEGDALAIIEGRGRAEDYVFTIVLGIVCYCFFRKISRIET
ncbi:MAG: hypothetical protein ACYTEQ_14670 [Planctomycetota bacterium]